MLTLVLLMAAPMAECPAEFERDRAVFGSSEWRRWHDEARAERLGAEVGVACRARLRYETETAHFGSREWATTRLAPRQRAAKRQETYRFGSRGWRIWRGR